MDRVNEKLITSPASDCFLDLILDTPVIAVDTQRKRAEDNLVKRGKSKLHTWRPRVRFLGAVPSPFRYATITDSNQSFKTEIPHFRAVFL